MLARSLQRNNSVSNEEASQGRQEQTSVPQKGGPVPPPARKEGALLLHGPMKASWITPNRNSNPRSLPGASCIPNGGHPKLALKRQPLKHTLLLDPVMESLENSALSLSYKDDADGVPATNDISPRREEAKGKGSNINPQQQQQQSQITRSRSPAVKLGHRNLVRSKHQTAAQTQECDAWSQSLHKARAHAATSTMKKAATWHGELSSNEKTNLPTKRRAMSQDSDDISTRNQSWHDDDHDDDHDDNASVDSFGKS